MTWLHDNTALLVVGGSRAYGIHHARSDFDLKGFAIAPAENLLGIRAPFEQQDKGIAELYAPDMPEPVRALAADVGCEGVVFELRKFLRLALENNPNVLEILFGRDSDILVQSPVGERIRRERHRFLSSRARHTFGGYAQAQLKRIRGHRAWLLHPPAAAPRRADFGLPETTLLPADQLAAAQAAIRKQLAVWELDTTGLSEAASLDLVDRVTRQLAEIAGGLGHVDDARWLSAARHVGMDDNIVLLLQKERDFEAASKRWRQFEEWRTTRNPARSALEAHHGYDTKHAAHLVRLLRMGREVLEEGEVKVWRGPGGAGDAEELLAIRNGAWSYDQLVDWADAERARLDRIVQEGRCVVPDAPDYDGIHALCVEVLREAVR